jgi:pyruvate/2-oxoglutarate dehydrogenase complex dihydrolipoamide acyltransferase (E2) component
MDGVLIEQTAKPGDAVAVGELLGQLDTGAAAPVVPSEVHPIGTAPKASAAPPAHALRPVARLADRAAVLAATHDGGFLSPKVRAKVAEHGLKPTDLGAVAGSGDGGRITADDIDRYLASGEPLSQVRQAVAASMSRSWSRPLATVARSVGVDALLAHRRTIAGRPSLTVYALRALALGLAAHSEFACRLTGNRMRRLPSIDLAVAVEIGDGVLTPVLRGVERISLVDLTAAVDQVIDRARAGRVADAGDAVASVSNYGVFGLTWATPIPLPGHSLILGLGDVQNTPDWDPATKSWGRARRAELTLTFDHRIADGGAAGRLLAAIADVLEHPERL